MVDYSNQLIGELDEINKRIFYIITYLRKLLNATRLEAITDPMMGIVKELEEFPELFEEIRRKVSETAISYRNMENISKDLAKIAMQLEVCEKTIDDSVPRFKYLTHPDCDLEKAKE